MKEEERGRRRGRDARVGSPCGVAARWRRKKVREVSSRPRETAAAMTPQTPRKCMHGEQPPGCAVGSCQGAKPGERLPICSELLFWPPCCLSVAGPALKTDPLPARVAASLHEAGTAPRDIFTRVSASLLPVIPTMGIAVHEGISPRSEHSVASPRPFVLNIRVADSLVPAKT
jgi:hypothetical protein